LAKHAIACRLWLFRWCCGRTQGANATQQYGRSAAD